MKYKFKDVRQRPVKEILESINMFNGTNLTLTSDMARSLSIGQVKILLYSMDPDNARHFSLIWVQAVAKFSRQVFDVVGSKQGIVFKKKIQQRST